MNRDLPQGPGSSAGDVAGGEEGRSLKLSDLRQIPSLHQEPGTPGMGHPGSSEEVQKP